MPEIREYIGPYVQAISGHKIWPDNQYEELQVHSIYIMDIVAI